MLGTLLAYCMISFNKLISLSLFFTDLECYLRMNKAGEKTGQSESCIEIDKSKRMDLLLNLLEDKVKKKYLTAEV